MKVLTLAFDSLTRFSGTETDISPLIFALDKLTVRHISTSGLVDLLT